MGQQQNDAFYETHMCLKILLEPDFDGTVMGGGGVSEGAVAVLEQRLDEQDDALVELRHHQGLMHASLQRLCDTQVKILTVLLLLYYCFTTVLLLLYYCSTSLMHASLQRLCDTQVKILEVLHITSLLLLCCFTPALLLLYYCSTTYIYTGEDS
jgi:hypothetical protein